MKLDKAIKRDKKRHNRRYGQRRSGDSVKLTQKIIIKKGTKNAS